METLISLIKKMLVGSNCNFRFKPHQVTKIMIKIVKIVRNMQMSCHNMGFSVGRAHPWSFLSVNFYMGQSAGDLICSGAYLQNSMVSLLSYKGSLLSLEIELFCNYIVSMVRES